MNHVTSEIVATAIYEQGVLRLLDPIALPDGARVGVWILSISEDDERQRIIQILASTGLVTSPTIAATDLLAPQDRLNDIAQRYAVGGPLSDLIIAERDGR